MTLFSSDMVFGIECPQCGRVFEETLGRLLGENYSCPLCGVPLDTEEFRQAFGEAGDSADDISSSGGTN